MDLEQEVSHVEDLVLDVNYSLAVAPKMGRILVGVSRGAKEAASTGTTASSAPIDDGVFRQAATLGPEGPIAFSLGRANVGRHESGREGLLPLSRSEKVVGSIVGLGQGSAEVLAVVLASMPSASKDRGAMGAPICPAGSSKRLV